MTIWAIADLHLAISVPDKSMEIFGPGWARYMERMEEGWRDLVKDTDLVLLPGDISWALTKEEAAQDLAWIDRLPGTKVMIKGNHDYWWDSLNKIKKICPPSIHPIQNNSFEWGEIVIGGSRLWDTPDFNYDPYCPPDNPPIEETAEKLEQDAKIFKRELHRLELSLKAMNKKAKVRIAMIHYPPLGPEMSPSPVSDLLEKYHIDICVFGHLHGIPPGTLPLGEKRGVKYYLVACDHVECTPVKILP